MEKGGLQTCLPCHITSGFSLLRHSHEHNPQLEEVVVLGILHLHHSPGVQAAPHLLPLGLDLLVGSHHRKWDASLEKGSSLCVSHT